MKKALRVWQLAILVALFAVWQLLAQPDLLPPFMWENPDRAAFFGSPLTHGYSGRRCGNSFHAPSALSQGAEG